jgi:hypothetical protein
MNQYIVTEEKIQKWVELDYSAKDCRNEVKEHPYNPQADRDCPVCGGGLMCHQWCIDRDCGWDSIRERRKIVLGGHTKDINPVKKEDMIFTPVRHVDGEL